MEATDGAGQFSIGVPWHKAGVLALEAHGLNDRCPLYGILLECVAQLGGAFGPVVITQDEETDSRAAICLARDGQNVWLSADLVELVALALHLQLPIYVDKVARRKSDETNSDHREVEIPSAFRQAFEKNALSRREDDPLARGER